MAREERAAAQRTEWAPYQAVSAHIGARFRAAHQVRGFATGFGPDDPRTWPLLERAADVERDGLNVEAALDAILTGGRLT
jgi:hypothetical protein